MGPINGPGKGENLRVVDRPVGGTVCREVQNGADGFAASIAKAASRHLTPEASGFRVSIQHDEVNLRAVETLGQNRVVADHRNRASAEGIHDIGSCLAVHFAGHNGAADA